MDWFVVFLATKLYLVVVVAGLLVFLYGTRAGRKNLFRVSLLALPTAFILSRLANFLVESPRPFVDGHMSALIEHAPDNGFPSDHTLLTVTVGAIIYTQNKLVGSILILLGILVGIGRVLSGVHHAIDIVGSITIAFVATYLAVLILRRWQI